MIARTHRFHGHNSLRYVYSHGTTIRSPLMAVKYCVNEQRKSYRLAVVVSKKVNKTAVVRNRIRRRIYEIIRQNENKIQHPIDIVITVFHDTVATTPDKELRSSIEWQLKKAGIIVSRKK